MKSIRVFLIAVIIAVIVVFNFIAAFHGYRSSIQAAEDLFDKQLVDAAKLIAGFNTEDGNINFNESSNLAFQVWDRDKQLKTSSSNMPVELTFNFEQGYDYMNFSSYRWRVLTYQNPINFDWIVVAERADLRYLLADSVVLKSILPIIVAIPFVGLLIWFLVGWGLRPLRHLSYELKHKQPNDLSPLSEQETRYELKQLVESTNELLERVASALDREQRFTADAAHELRTPISVLKVQLYNLEQELDEENEALLELQSGVNRIQHLVEQLLILYRAEPQSLIEQFQTLDLKNICQQVIADNYEAIEAKQQNIELLAENIKIKGNEFAIATLLKNLISNANKYTPKGGSIKVKVYAEAAHACLTVEDSGIGINEIEKEKIFERFYRRAQKQQTEQLPGCGLGLTIVKHIATIHNAHVHVEKSEFESGSLFKIIFDRAID